MTAPINKENTGKKPRCFNCSKKLGILNYDCQCSNKFCAKCRLPETHNCTFNFKDSGRDKLANNLVQVVGEKVIKI